MKSHSFFSHVFLGVVTTLLLGSCSPNAESSQSAAAPVKKEVLQRSGVTDKADQRQIIPPVVKSIMIKNQCLGCHRLDQKMVGPSFQEIAQRGYDEETLIALIKTPKPENWPDYPPMAPMEWIEEGDLQAMAKWMARVEPVLNQE